MFGCLGLGNEECQIEPVHVPELGKKQVKGELFRVEKKVEVIFRRST